MLFPLCSQAVYASWLGLVHRYPALNYNRLAGGELPLDLRRSHLYFGIGCKTPHGRQWFLHFGRKCKLFGDPDEFSKRIHMHFLHHVATVHFDRRFASAKLTGDLFVKETSSDQPHYFLLAITERFVPLAQFFRLRPLHSDRTVPIHGLLDSIQALLVAAWFGEKLPCPCFHGAYRHLNVAVPRNEYNRNLKIRVSKLTLQVQSAQAGESHV